jgi:hypothetical protein
MVAVCPVPGSLASKADTVQSGEGRDGVVLLKWMLWGLAALGVALLLAAALL